MSHHFKECAHTPSFLLTIAPHLSAAWGKEGCSYQHLPFPMTRCSSGIPSNQTSCPFPSPLPWATGVNTPVAQAAARASNSQIS